MGYFLSLGGAAGGSYLKTPVITFDEIIMDYVPYDNFNGGLLYHIDTRDDVQTANPMVYTDNVDNEFYSNFSSQSINGTPVTSGSNTMPNGQRVTLRVTCTAKTVAAWIGARYTNIQNLKMDLYSVKFLNAGVVVAHYDMNTQTVQDQSGNGNHATLAGGTWGGFTPDTGKTYHLSFDGVDDYLSVPSIAFDRVELDIYLDPVQPVTYAYYLCQTNGAFRRVQNSNSFFGSGFATTGEVIGQRTNVSATLTSPVTSTVSIFNRYNSGTSYAYISKGLLYRARFYNGATLVADYDISKGTVNDQSGNGNHATLTGGTWVEDGTTPTGTPGSVSFDVRNEIYKSGSTDFDTRPEMYESGSTSYDSIQLLYSSSIVHYDTLQEIFDPGSVGFVNFDLKVEIFSTSEKSFDTEQSMYETGFSEYDTEQGLYSRDNILVDTEFVIYDSNFVEYDFLQEIYLTDSALFDVVQIMFDPDKSVVDRIYLAGQKALYIQLQGERVLRVDLEGKKILNINLEGVIR